jgi:hypothetical protein
LTLEEHVRRLRAAQRPTGPTATALDKHRGTDGASVENQQTHDRRGYGLAYVE